MGKRYFLAVPDTRGERGAVFCSEKNIFSGGFLPPREAHLRGKAGEKHLMEINQKELAEILGLSDRRIRQLIKDYGLFSAYEGGGKRQKRYVLEKCIQEYIAYKVSEETGRGTSKNKEEVQAQHEEIKKNISILKLRKLKRELHAAVDVEEFLTEMLVQFRARLMVIPQKIGPLAAIEEDENKIIALLEREVFETLETLSEYDPMKIEKEDPILYLDDEDDEEGEE